MLSKVFPFQGLLLQTKTFQIRINKYAEDWGEECVTLAMIMKFTCFVFAFFYCINIIINEIYTIIFKKCTKEQVCALTKITILNSGPMFQTFLNSQIL